MGKTKHTYTEDAFPTNTGSLNRPGRLNLRMDCQVRARTHAVFQKFRRVFGMPKNACYAYVWESKILPTLEHTLRKIEEGDTATSAFFKKLADPLPKVDHLRAIYQRLKARFEKRNEPIHHS